MSTDSIKKLLPFIIFFTLFSYVFSPTGAEVLPLEEGSAFLNYPPMKKLIVMTITGYSSSFDETDDTPWITAYNTSPNWGTAASNVLPYGTKLKIPSLFGDQIFIIEDKMNPRYNENLDIWFPSKWEALNFGIHYDVIVEIVD